MSYLLCLSGWIVGVVVCFMLCQALETEADKGFRLRMAVRRLYYAGVWSCDRSVDEVGLWTAVRDAAGFEPGHSPKPL